MRATLVCVGRLTREYRAVWSHYEGLLRPYLTLAVLEAPETPLSLGVDVVRAKEGTALRNLLRPGAYTVAVDGRGKEYSSEAWRALLADRKVNGQHHASSSCWGVLSGWMQACWPTRRSGGRSPRLLFPIRWLGAWSWSSSTVPYG